MLVPLSWLRDYLPLDPALTEGEGLARLGETMDSLGLVVERVEHVGRGLEGVVVARVADIAPIEGADKIRRVVVEAGGPDPVEVVCGAWNFAVGDLVPLATVGTTLPGGMRIEKRKLRGVTSRGMLCSSAELALAEDAEGILVLHRPGQSEPARPVEEGTPLADHLGIVPDVVFDLAIEPNRPDCLSMVGIARDLAAKLGLELVRPEPAPPAAGPATGELAAIAVEDPGSCSRLVAKTVTGLTPCASPPLVQRRLLLAGMRPISAVVDASNYAMLELGQPTHAYDLDRLGGGGIAVRLARPGEHLVTLDGIDRLLGEGPTPECVVADLEDRVVGLAGVMGGADTEVGPGTTRVLVESAAFDARTVARAARRHGLRSEASVRFERGIDPEGLARAAERVAELVAEAAAEAGAPPPSVSPGILDERPVPARRERIVLRTARLNGLLGTSLGAAEAASYLEPIGFSTRPVDDGLEVEVPSFRPDVALEVDLVEEVARHHGYERIAATSRRSPSVGRLSPAQAARRSIRRLLTGAGVDEAWTSSIVDPATARRLGGTAVAIGLANPMVAEESVLRTHLLPGLLEALRRNASRRNEHVRFFELGAVFAARAAGGGAPASLEALVEERELLGVLLAGDGDDAAAAVACWRRLAEGLRLDEGALHLDQHLGAAPAEPSAPGGAQPGGAQPGDLEADLGAGCHPTRRATIVAEAPGGERRLVGALGEVDPDLLAAFGLPGERRVGWLVVDLERLLSAPRRGPLARPVSRFPSSDIDLAFLLPASAPAAALVEAVAEAAGPLGEWARVIDAFRGGALGEGARSVTVRARLCAPDRTLSDADIAGFRDRAVDLAATRLGAALRA